MVEAPIADTNDATGGTTESGISDSRGLVFTGTPTAAGFDRRVSVSVDLSMTGPQRSTLTFTPTAVLTGPGTARPGRPRRAARGGAGRVRRRSCPDECRCPGSPRPPRAPAGSDVNTRASSST